MYYKAEVKVDVYEDDYEEGEGQYVQTYDLPEFKANTLKKLFDELESYMGDREGWLLTRINDYEWASEIMADQLQNGDGMEPSPREKRMWERGEITLYSAHFHALVSKVGEFPVSLERMSRYAPRAEVD